MLISEVNRSTLYLADYDHITPSHQMNRVRSLGDSLRTASIVHMNSTSQGGGVAEILNSMVPLMNDSGPDTNWLVIDGYQEFFEVTKRLHNTLQGAGGEISEREFELYVNHNARIAEELIDTDRHPDVWVLHDPQLLPLVSMLPPGSKVIWVCHIDTTNPNVQVLGKLLPFMQYADRVVFSLPEYVAPGLGRNMIKIIPPAIDPLIVKNKELEVDAIEPILSRLGLDVARPIISQVARFDTWKDPWGVIDAYRIVKNSIPTVQLALLGVIDAQDDPEAYAVLESVQEHANNDPDIHLYSDPEQVGQLEVSAVQTGADVILQKSLREGFGLSVAEALWKGTPVIGGNCGGIRLQIDHGKTGYLVDSVDECATFIIKLLNNYKLGRWMGVAAREKVRQRFLTPRILGDYLQIVHDVLTESYED